MRATRKSSCPQMKEKFLGRAAGMAPAIWPEGRRGHNLK
jgi:hypothetical protein